MGGKNTYSLLIALVVGAAAVLSTMFVVFVRFLPDKLVFGLFCAVGFFIISALSVATAKSVTRSFVEPRELTAARLLAGIEDEVATGQSVELSELATRLLSELEDYKQRERLIADYTPDILIRLDASHKIVDLNAQSEVLLQVPKPFLIGTQVVRWVAPEERLGFEQYLEGQKSAPSEVPHECRIRTQTGELIDLEWHVDWSNSFNSFYCLAKNVTDRKDKERLRAEITALVAHDLQTPLTGLSMMLENLNAGDYGPVSDLGRDRIQKAEDAVRQMLRMIRHLLDAEKIESGRMSIELTIVPLSDVYDCCADMTFDLANKRNLKIQFPESTNSIHADFDRTCQILSNLLSNAIKWSPAGSIVSITERVQDDFVEIAVSDQGPGISESVRTSIFDRFKSGGSGDQQLLTSTGLGLYLTKKLVELQHGYIDFTSSSGQGTTFRVSLKRAK